MWMISVEIDCGKRNLLNVCITEKNGFPIQIVAVTNNFAIKTSIMLYFWDKKNLIKQTSN